MNTAPKKTTQVASIAYVRTYMRVDEHSINEIRQLTYHNLPRTDIQMSETLKDLPK